MGSGQGAVTCPRCGRDIKQTYRSRHMTPEMGEWSLREHKCQHCHRTWISGQRWLSVEELEDMLETEPRTGSDVMPSARA